MTQCKHTSTQHGGVSSLPGKAELSFQHRCMLPNPQAMQASVLGEKPSFHLASFSTRCMLRISRPSTLCRGSGSCCIPALLSALKGWRFLC